MKKIMLLAFAATGGLMAQTPTIVSVINTESPTQTVSAPLCPGILATIYGTGFGSSAAAVTVTVGGQNAWVDTAAGGVIPTQINVQLPFNVAAGQTNVVVTVGGASSAPFSITLLTAAPTLPLYGTTPYGLFSTLQSTFISNSNLATPGEVLVLYGTGFGPTNPMVPPGLAPNGPTPTVNTASLTVGGVTAVVSFAGLSPGLAGLYQVNFTVPSTVQGSVPVALSIDGQTSNTVMLPVQGISAIVSAASFQDTGTATAEEIVTIYANGVGSKDEITQGYQTTTAQGISVTFNGTPAPIFALVTESSQLNVIVPTELPSTGTVQVQLNTPTFQTTNFPLLMDAAVPGIFLDPIPGNATADIAAAQFANTTWLVVPTSAATALGIAQNCTASKANPVSNCGQPAAPGDYVVLYVTGLGLATPKGDPNGTPLTTGVAAPADGSVLYETVATPTVMVGTTAATPLFSGIAPGFAGLYQINFQIPAGVAEGDSVALTVAMPGSTTGSATMAIHSR